MFNWKFLQVFFCFFTLSNSYGQWINQISNSPFGRGIRSFSSTASGTIWATTYDALGNYQQVKEILISTNGTTWSKLDINIPGNYGVTNVCVLNNNEAFIGLYPAYPDYPTTASGVYKTSDGGNNWSKLNINQLSNQSVLNAVYFWDSQNGLCFGNPVNGSFQVLFTNDGGNSWQNSIGNFSALSQEKTVSCGWSATANQFLFVTGSGRIFISNNKGNSFVSVQSPSTRLNFIKMFNPTWGVIRNYDPQNNIDEIAFTTNGGQTWEIKNIVGNCMPDDLLNLPNTSILISTGAKQDIYGTSYSLDSGATWITLNDNQEHTRMISVNDTTIYCGAFSDSSGFGIIQKFNYAAFIQTLTLKADLKNDITISPNPAKDYISIFYPSKPLSKERITIKDYTGKLLLTHNVEPNEIKIELPLRNLVNGIYFLEFSFNGHSISKKISINR